MSAARRVLSSMAIAALVSGCSGLLPGAGTTVGSSPYEEGSGNLATETRAMDAFHGVSAAQGVQVEIAAGAPSVAVTADDNLLPHVATVVADGILSIDVTGSLRASHPLKVVVKMEAAPDGLTASTGASIEAPVPSTGSLRVSASTGAHVRCTGSVESLAVTASTGGTADLGGLQARTATVDVSAGSSVIVMATESVSGSATGGASVHVRGTGSTDGISHDVSSSVDHQ